MITMKAGNSEAAKIRRLEKEVKALKAEVCRLEAILDEKEEDNFEAFLDDVFYCPHNEVSMRSH